MKVTIALWYVLLVHACSALQAFTPSRNGRRIRSCHKSTRSDFSAITTNDAFETYCRGGDHIPFVCIEHALSEDFIASLRHDASSLRASGFGATSGVASKVDVQNIRHGVHQIWMQSPGSPLLHALVGNLDSRKELQRLVETIRQSLCNEDRVLAPEFVELSYVFYDEGSFYKRHIDTTIRRNGKNFKRSVSIILYLGDPNFDKQAWHCESDGGALRVYNDEGFKVEDVLQRFDVNSNDGFADISPNPGTLVVFDSAVVPHEVLTTYRSRTVIVGWFGEETEP